jgi:hypothetical protein
MDKPWNGSGFKFKDGFNVNDLIKSFENKGYQITKKDFHENGNLKSFVAKKKKEE